MLELVKRWQSFLEACPTGVSFGSTRIQGSVRRATWSWSCMLMKESTLEVEEDILVGMKLVVALTKE